MSNSPPSPAASRSRSPAPVYRRTPLRSACVQYDVKLGKVKENVAKVEEMTKWLTPGSLDLLVLPEMCLSGYIFPTPASIMPYLEPPRIGPTSLLARSLSTRLKCHVIAGYPERLEDAQQSGVVSGEAGADSEMSKAAGVGYNSALISSPSGEIVGNYRKTFLFDTDKNWARAGDGFKHFDLGGALGRVVVGICMDMNPKDFVAPWDAFELANFVRDNAVDTLVVPMNWLDPPAEPPNEDPPQNPLQPSISNLNYWAARLTPLHDPAPGYSPPFHSEGGEGKEGKEVVFVTCNRVGEEAGTKFIGTSSVLSMSSDPSRIELIECCNISEERVLLAEV
ncbi:hypothetical protein L202_05766 [Cryptococcus amylolentus CBS 6039]|uniref:CN hydrolase domain-containing protein n=1 Tax=Cryptococcus amylolentus CBS 6039 TaxID=1295533 RepID=A0A1E3HI07_9TREE|nr:hypothetical protein L202_05766 [Cryptococcus amylolentus CBS 6039]ODN75755.1 hypothetical protein L202_05766 [Cryptococcus amylolentus CBS 6039]